jgi:hypothetical protein
MGGEEGMFPLTGDVDAEAPGSGRVGFVAPEFTRDLVHFAVVDVPVDCGGAGVQPDGRGTA